MTKCRAHTKTGKRCNNEAVEGSEYCHIKSHREQSPEASLTDKQRRFVEEYCVDYNATAAAKRAGYSKNSASEIGFENLRKPQIANAIKKRMEELAMSAEEAVKRLADWGRGTAHPFLQVNEKTGELHIDLSSEKAQQNLHLIKKLKQHDTIVQKGGGDKDEVISRTWEIELHDQKDAVDKILKVIGAYAPQKHEDVTPQPKRLVLIEKVKE